MIRFEEACQECREVAELMARAFDLMLEHQVGFVLSADEVGADVVQAMKLIKIEQSRWERDQAKDHERRQQSRTRN